MISLVLFTILFYILFTVFLWYILRFQIPPLIPIFWNRLFELINLIIDNKLKIKKSQNKLAMIVKCIMVCLTM